jgi:hypothetical protein
MGLSLVSGKRRKLSDMKCGVVTPLPGTKDKSITDSRLFFHQSMDRLELSEISMYQEMGFLHDGKCGVATPIPHFMLCIFVKDMMHIAKWALVYWFCFVLTDLILLFDKHTLFRI